MKIAIFEIFMKCLQMENINIPYEDIKLQIDADCICLNIR